MNIQFDPLLSSDYSQIAYNVFQTDLYSEYVPRVRAKIVKSQFGFKTKRNTVTQLIHYLDALYDCLDQNIPFSSVYFDFAFDTVPHDLLIKKLPTFGFP